LPTFPQGPFQKCTIGTFSGVPENQRKKLKLLRLGSKISHLKKKKKFFVTNLTAFRLPNRNRKEQVITATDQVAMTQSEFLEIVMPFKDKLYRLAKRLLISSEEAEDATQEILMKLWSGKKKIASYRNVEAFAMTMTKNFCLDRLKSKQAGNLKLVHSNYSDGTTSLQKEVEVRDSLGWVEKIMDELPEQQRMILQLRDVEAYEYDEIEKLMDMKPTAVRVALSRARKAVREKLLEKHRYGIG
jgi:RNA polymerase sigma factor (sigma-70 family)